MSGALVCEFFDLMVSKAQRGWNKCARLFHQPLEQPFYGARHWFDQQVHGKSFTTTAVSKYAAMLRLLDPTFPRHKFTNGSVRKCHTYVLNMSNLPASVQQKSLGHISARGSQLWRTTYNNPSDLLSRPQLRTRSKLILLRPLQKDKHYLPSLDQQQRKLHMAQFNNQRLLIMAQFNKLCLLSNLQLESVFPSPQHMGLRIFPSNFLLALL